MQWGLWRNAADCLSPRFMFRCLSYAAQANSPGRHCPGVGRALFHQLAKKKMSQDMATEKSRGSSSSLKFPCPRCLCSVLAASLLVSYQLVASSSLWLQADLDADEPPSAHSEISLLSPRHRRPTISSGSPPPPNFIVFVQLTGFYTSELV